MPRLTSFLVFLFAMPLTARPPLAAQQPPFDPAGYWEGAILIRPGEYEIDLQLTLKTCKPGGLCGILALPTQDQEPLEVKDLKIQGDALSFQTLDDQGAVSIFRGTASQDRQTLEGTLSEGQREAPFTLSRALGPSALPAEVEVLAGGSQLRDAFNQSLDKTRLILILSPT